MLAWTDPSLIVTGLEAKDSTEVITVLGSLLHEHGYVADTFTAAVLEREKTFATGLPTPGRHVAIPHTDPEHVIRPAIAIAVLKQPVSFGEMGSPDSRIDIDIVCMLAVKQSESLVVILQTLVEMFQTPGLLQQVIGSDPIEIAGLFNPRLSVREEA